VYPTPNRFPFLTDWRSEIFFSYATKRGKKKEAFIFSPSIIHKRGNKKSSELLEQRFLRREKKKGLRRTFTTAKKKGGVSILSWREKVVLDGKKRGGGRDSLLMTML